MEKTVEVKNLVKSYNNETVVLDNISKDFESEKCCGRNSEWKSLQNPCRRS